jgi:hypothetical protein
MESHIHRPVIPSGPANRMGSNWACTVQTQELKQLKQPSPPFYMLLLT